MCSQEKSYNYEPTQDSGFISFLNSLSKKSPLTVRIFDRGEFYTTHGEDALLAATDLFHTNSVIRYVGADKVPSVSLSKLNFEVFIKSLLLVKHYRVEVYEQKVKGKQDWQVKYKGSPGNLLHFEDILFTSNVSKSMNNGVMSVCYSSSESAKTIGVAVINLDEEKFILSEFIDSDAFCNLEAMIVHLGPKECIIPLENSLHSKKLKQILSRNNLLITERKRGDFSFKDMQDVGRLIRSQTEESLVMFGTKPEVTIKNSLCALNAVITYLELLSSEENWNKFTVSAYKSESFMRLDIAAINALHIDSVESNSTNTTLLSLLDKCKSPLGRRLLSQWIRQPLMDQRKIEERQNLVESLLSCVELRHSLGEDFLRRIPDLQRVSRKLGRKSAKLQDCYRLFLCVQRIPDLCQALGQYDGIHVSTIASIFLTPLQEIYANMEKFQEMLNTTLNMELAAQGEFFVKPDFDEELQEIHEGIVKMDEEFNKIFKRAASDLSLEMGKTIKLESNQQHGYFFRVTLKEEKALRNNKSYQTIDTNKAGVRFTNSSLKNLNNEYLKSKDAYTLQQKNLADEIIAVAAGYSEVISDLSGIMAHLDSIYALAETAASAPVSYCRPIILPKGTGIVKLSQCRHPCLEIQDQLAYIPNDCTMDREHGIFHIITGPNMGGKSTFLRSVALTVLMAQIGSYVPCSDAEISIVDGIFARVGAGDCQLKGASTFMTEMLEISSVMKSATKDSLVVIDELGRGTSTYDGFGIAWAVSEHIAKDIQCFSLFATHFHELTDLENKVDTVKNYHVSATTEGGALTLLYQVNPGYCDRSFGIHVAELAKFPTTIIENARMKAKELEKEYIDNSEENIDVKSSVKEGEIILEEYCKKIEHLNYSSDEHLQNELKRLKEELLQKNNLYINKILL